MSELTLDEQVAMVGDCLEDGLIDTDAAVLILMEATDLSPRMAGHLLIGDVRYRIRHASDRAPLRDRDGRWSQ